MKIISRPGAEGEIVTDAAALRTEVERLRAYATELHWTLVDIRDNAFMYEAENIRRKADAVLRPLTELEGK